MYTKAAYKWTNGPRPFAGFESQGPFGVKSAFNKWSGVSHKHTDTDIITQTHAHTD